MSTTLAFRLDEATRERLGHLAEATDRTVSYLAQQAIKDYLDANEWQLQAIQAGIQAADEGRLVEHEALLDKWERRRADTVD